MSQIAVIMSVYKNDRLEYLKEALSSLYAQTRQADIFIQQDGEVSLEIEAFLDNALAEDKIVYLGKREKNIGLAGSLNDLLVVVLSKYQYIMRMDADDISIFNRVEEQFRFMEKYPKIDVVGSYIEEFSREMVYVKLVKYPLTHIEMFDFFNKRVPLAHVSAFFRNSFFQKAGLYPTDSSTNEDTLLWMNGFKSNCQFANIAVSLVDVRVGKAFFGRRGGYKKALSDLKDRIKVIRRLGYNFDAYVYAVGVLIVNISPGFIKKFLYKRLR